VRIDRFRLPPSCLKNMAWMFPTSPAAGTDRLEETGLASRIACDGDRAVDHLLNVAYYEGIWRSIASIVAAVILILCLSTSVGSALMIVAHVALFFTILMIRNAAELARMSLPRAVAQAQPRMAIPWTGCRASVLTLTFAKVGSVIAATCAAGALVL